jgi:YHS domain-containing protein
MKVFPLFLLAFLFIHTGSAQTAEQRKRQFNVSGSSPAIQGYDPVAYFKQQKAIKGTAKISAVYAGLVYHFSSEANRDVFRSDPSKYEPQYGGWCAYAMGKSGEKVEVDPETFKIVEGRLFLFYNKYFNNTLKSWNKDEAALLHKADLNWSKIIKAGI